MVVQGEGEKRERRKKRLEDRADEPANQGIFFETHRGDFTLLLCVRVSERRGRDREFKADRKLQAQTAKKEENGH